MFLVERLIGVSIYSYILIMICVLIAFSTLRVKGILWLYLLLLAGMGYCYKPYITADLYRIFQATEWYATMDFPGFFRTLVITSSVPVSRILFWLVGKTGLPHLLPVISSFVSYGCIFYIIEHAGNRFSISRQNVAVALFFVMSTSIYISVIGGIRMMMAISLIAFCFYRESVERKRNILHIALCLIAVFMHDMALIVLVILAISIIFDRQKPSSQKLLWTVILAAMAIGGILYFNTKILRILDKSMGYIQGESYYDVWEYLMGGILLISFFLISWKFKPLRKEYASINRLNTASTIATCIAILFCYVFSIFYRFVGHLVPILTLPIIMITLEKTKDGSCRQFKVISLQSMMILLSIALLFIGASRGSLSALKFFVIN